MRDEEQEPKQARSRTKVQIVRLRDWRCGGGDIEDRKWGYVKKVRMVDRENVRTLSRVIGRFWKRSYRERAAKHKGREKKSTAGARDVSPTIYHDKSIADDTRSSLRKVVASIHR